MAKSATFVNRIQELGLLSALLAGVAERGSSLVVSGPAGIGKSTLLEVAVERAARAGMGVLTAYGVESEAHLPFAGLHQILRPVLDTARELETRQADALFAAFGMNDRVAPEVFVVGLAVIELLADTAARSPLLVVVEDAHWLDVPSAEVLAFVAQRLAAEPITLLAVVRTGYDTPLTRQGLPELRLGELDATASAQLLDAHAPRLAPRLRERVLAEAAGTPLALLDLPAVLSEAEPPGVPSALPLTDRLKAAYAARLVDLSPSARAVLVVAAADDSDDLDEILRAARIVAGADRGAERGAERGDEPGDERGHAEGDEAAVVADALMDAVVDAVVDAAALQPAIRAELVRSDGTHVSFRHPLVRSAVYQAASMQERRRAHAALAAVLEPGTDRRAWHLAAATVQPDEAVAAAMEEAAQRAVARGGSAVALAAMQRAAQLSPDSGSRGRRLIQAAELALGMGELLQAASLLVEADSLVTDVRDRSRLALMRQMVEPATPGDRRRVDALVEAGTGFTAAGEPDLALSFFRAAAMDCWWVDPGEDARRSVIAAAEQVPVPPTDPRLLCILGFTDPAGQGETLIRRASTLAPGDYDPDTAHLLGAALTLVGAFHLSAAFLEAAADGLRASGRMSLLPMVLTQQAWTGINMVDWDIAVPAADEAVRLARETGQLLWLAAAQSGQGMLAALRAEPDAAEEFLRESEAIALPMRASAVLCGVQLTRGVAALGVGRYDDAFAELSRVFDSGDPSHHHYQSSWAVGEAVEAAVHSGRTDWARELVARHERVAEVSANPWLHVGLLLARPLLADDDDVERLFREGLAADLSRWPVYRARLLLEFGTWLRRRQRIIESRGPLKAAVETLDALGITAWTARARQELHVSGGTSSPPERGVWSELSPQELQIAQLVRQGLTNREIGQRLFLSHRTVGSHLYRIFPKLGITSRAQLQALGDGLEEGAAG